MRENKTIIQNIFEIRGLTKEKITAEKQLQEINEKLIRVKHQFRKQLDRIKRLKDREKEIMYFRYFLGYSRKEVAKLRNLSACRIDQIEYKAIDMIECEIKDKIRDKITWLS